jgi:hypothetical protein
MNIEQIRALLRIKRVIDQLRDIDQSTLTPTEREAWKNMMAQAYDRATYLLQKHIYGAVSREESRWTDQRQKTD